VKIKKSTVRLVSIPLAIAGIISLLAFFHKKKKGK